MHTYHIRHIIQIIFLIMPLLLVSQDTKSKQVIGWVEYAVIQPGNITLKAKMDSGAKTSSLHCDCQQFIKKNGQKFIKFSMTTTDGKQVTLEKKVLRISKVKRHFGEMQERAVIKLGICLSDIYKEIEVNVVDRSGLNYQMLIGRNFLAGNFLIDSANKFSTEPRCSK